MAVRIGHASVDENGKIQGGKAGDQTQKEVCIRSYYNKGWNVVLRPKKQTLAEKSAKFVEQACSNNNIGYDQWNRNTLYAQAIVVNFNASKIATPCECDCSALMHVAAIAGGSVLAYGVNALTTRTMRSAFQASGDYEVLTDNKYLSSDTYLKRGDILVKEGSHTVMVLDNGSVENTEPTRVLYYKTPMMVGEDVKWLQRKLIDYGCLAAVNTKGKSNIDGKLGKDTANAIGRFQAMVGIKVDKKCGPETRKHLN